MELSQLKGVGKIKLQQLNDAGIFSCEDLINYFPQKYYDFKNYACYNDDDFSKIILCIVIEEPKVVKFKGINYVSVKVRDSSGTIFNAVWYNQLYIKSTLIVGEKYFLYGKNSPKRSRTFVVSMTKPASKQENNVLAVYKKIGSIGTANIKSWLEQILNNFEYQGILPLPILSQYKLIGLNEAYRKIHFPNCIEDYQQAKQRLDIERLVPLAVKNLNQTIIGQTLRGNKYNNINAIYTQFCKLLPFSLTKDQERAILDIIGDLDKEKSMNRLLQGEVGSGKTMVAFFCLYLAVQNGYQSSMIAPTEILAIQHYQNLVKVFSNTKIKIVYLSGSMSAKEKKDALQLIKHGIANIVVGTHAVIGKDVEFKNLALAVIDEQHRFGVAQRAKLSAKGSNVDTLVMSATPIPRSMALAIYGDLSLSIISTCPFAKDITTNIVSISKQPDMWQYVLEKSQNGSKIFVVCANIDEDEELDTDMSATSVYNKIVNLFGKDKVLLLHGKQSKETQNQTINSFISGEYCVLVATTIVEVGVDIPEADIIIIASPEKFGLATLHQLRGRVGRDGSKSFCFCLANNGLGEKSLERLKYFKDHSSGFDIAEYDYKTRGSGDIYGTAQHGIKSNFSINLLNYDKALDIANEIVKDEKTKNTILEIAEKNYSKLCNDIVLN